MKTIYAGKCKVCEREWQVGDEIFFQKSPKCICIDKACYDRQVRAGGQDKVEKADANKLVERIANSPVRTDEQKLTDAIKMVELCWCPALKKASEVYPDLPPSNNLDVSAWNNSQKEIMRNRMILAQVIYKSMVESWIR